MKVHWIMAQAPGRVLALAKHLGRKAELVEPLPPTIPARMGLAKISTVRSRRKSFDRRGGLLDDSRKRRSVVPMKNDADKTPELRMTRVFDAPKRIVFDAWSKAESVARWFTPAPLTTPSCEVDFRAGGVFRLVMKMPNGVEHPMDGEFTEIVAAEKIAFVARIHGGVEIQTTVTFSERDGKTTLDVHQVYSHESDATRGANAGWTATLDQLAAHLRNGR